MSDQNLNKKKYYKFTLKKVCFTFLSLSFFLSTSLYAQNLDELIANALNTTNRYQTIVDNNQLSVGRAVTIVGGRIFPNVSVTGDQDTETFNQTGSLYSYPQVLVRDNHIFINPFPNFNETDKFKQNPLYHITPQNYSYADEKPGALYINDITESSRRALAFSTRSASGYATQHFFKTDFQAGGGEKNMLFCHNDVNCSSPLIKFASNGNVGVGLNNPSAEVSERLVVNGILQVEGPIFAKIEGVPVEGEDPYAVFFNLYNFQLNPNFWYDDANPTAKKDEDIDDLTKLMDPRGLAELNVIALDFLKMTDPDGEIESESLLTTNTEENEFHFNFMFRGTPRNLCRDDSNTEKDLVKQDLNSPYIFEDADNLGLVEWVCASVGTTKIEFNGITNPHVEGGAIAEPYAPKKFPYPWYYEKPFIISHPTKSDRYLIHSALEGPEVAVFYRGTALLTKGVAKVELPHYFKELVTLDSVTIHLTPINSDEKLIVSSLDNLEKNYFQVLSENKQSQQEFYWEVKATRQDGQAFTVEPNKDTVQVEGFGPYRYFNHGETL